MMQKTPPVLELLAALVQFYEYVRAMEVPVEVWGNRPDDQHLTLTEIMCHLRDVEIEVHQARFRAILAAENPFLAGHDTDLWITERTYAEQDGAAARLAFLRAREGTLTLLAGLAEADWQRTGRHSFLGTTTIHELLAMAVSHEQEHWAQLRGLLGG
ncbi:MAG: DinB family protein [Anaerolineales bacterium]|nr:DinB family protein [Anaerolineales bacterium]